jgi:polar amino acid transport system substrate-binding protein
MHMLRHEITRRAALRTSGIILLAGKAWSGPPAPARTYIVGSTATGVPFSFLDVKTTKLIGAMVDIVQAIAADSGFIIDLRVTAFGALIPSLTTKKIDIISAAMLKTPARAKVVDFSEPVYAYGAGIVVPVISRKEYKTIDDLRGTAVGAEVGTRFVEQLKGARVREIKTYDNLMEIVRRFERWPDRRGLWRCSDLRAPTGSGQNQERTHRHGISPSQRGGCVPGGA